MERKEIIERLKKYFTLPELVCPHVYRKYSESQIWSFFTTEALGTLLVLREEIICKPFTINNWQNGGSYSQRGLRCNVCVICKGKTMLERPYLSAHCFDEKTEILTENGWTGIKDIENCKYVYSYNIQKEIIELSKINSVIKQHFEGEMVKISSLNCDILVTDEHRMLVRSKCKKYKRKGGKIISTKGQEYFDSLKTDNDKWHIELANQLINKRRKFLCASILKNENENFDLDFAKICLATIADGRFSLKKNSCNIRFRLKKERKCKELENILSILKWKYSVTKDKENVYNYCINSNDSKKVFNVIGKNKFIPFDFLNAPANILKEMVKYYAFYDGCFDKRINCKCFSISSIIKNNIDILQIMCVLSGMRAQIKYKPKRIYNIKGQTGIGKPYYVLSINLDKKETDIKESSATLLNYSGDVWCVNNDNTTVIIRRNGKVSIQGNCLGRAFDVTVSGMEAEAARKIIVDDSDKLPYPIRLEDGVSWLHVDTMDLCNEQKVTLFKA